MSPASPDAPRAVLTVTGADRPGVTARLFSALAQTADGPPAVEVLDVEQVVVHGHLVLGVVVASLPTDGGPPPGDKELLAHLERVAEEVAADVSLSVTVESASERDPAPVPAGRPHHVIVLGRPVPPDAVAGAARGIAAIGGNIDAIRRLSDYPVTSFELTVSGAEATALRTELAQVASATGADIAVEQVGLARRSKRLIVLDVDSTLVRGEVIDELAARAGRAAEVARITAAAMNGELDFAESLRARVGVLAGLPVEVLDEVREALVLTPGARTLIRTLQRLGFRCGIVSGGFTQITDPLAEALGLDFAPANTLQGADGRLPGRRGRGSGGPAGWSARSWTVRARPGRWPGSPPSTGSRWRRRWRSATAPTTWTCSAPQGWASRSTPSRWSASRRTRRSTSPTWTPSCRCSASPGTRSSTPNPEPRRRPPRRPR